MDYMIVAKPEMSPKKRVLLEGGLILVGAAVLVLIEGGHPYSNWFYVLVGVMFVAGTYRGLKGQRPMLPTNPPLAVGSALREAIVRGFVAAIFVYALVLTLNGELYQWTSAILLGVVIGVQQYWWQRGKKAPSKYYIVICAAYIGLAAIYVFWKVSRQ